jgi:hypothetical protein
MEISRAQPFLPCCPSSQEHNSYFCGKTQEVKGITDIVSSLLSVAFSPMTVL